MNIFIQTDKMRFTHCDFEGYDGEQEAAMLPALAALEAIKHALWSTCAQPHETVLEKMRELVEEIGIGISWHEITES